MAVPKKRTAKSKKNSRRSHHFAVARALSNCNKCKAAVPAHTACPTCGTYKGRDVINVMKDVERKQQTAAS